MNFDSSRFPALRGTRSSALFSCWLSAAVLLVAPHGKFTALSQDQSDSRTAASQAGSTAAAGQTAPRSLPRIDVDSLTDASFVDQFQNEHDFEFPAERVRILTANGKAGANQVQSWTIPLRKEFGERIRIFSVADLTTVPRFLRNHFRRQFQADWKQPVILDFTGAITDLLPMDPDHVIVLLFDRNGTVRYANAGPADAVKLEEIAEVIRTETGRHAPIRSERSGPKFGAVKPRALRKRR